MVINVTRSRPASRSGTGPEHGVIVAEELVKTYPGEIQAVRGISFSVAAGESFGLLGPERGRKVHHDRHAEHDHQADVGPGLSSAIVAESSLT